MKRKLLIGLALVLMSSLALVGCGGEGVSQEDYDAVVDERDAAQADLAELQDEYDAVVADRDAAQGELTELHDICPPRNFGSLSELETWLASNSISDEPPTTYADGWLRKALRLQEDALADGYIVSADYDYDIEAEGYVIWCTTVIGGTLFYWDPETDEVFEEFMFGTLQ